MYVKRVDTKVYYNVYGWVGLHDGGCQERDEVKGGGPALTLPTLAVCSVVLFTAWCRCVATRPLHSPLVLIEASLGVGVVAS